MLCRCQARHTGPPQTCKTGRRDSRLRCDTGREERRKRPHKQRLRCGYRPRRQRRTRGRCTRTRAGPSAPTDTFAAAKRTLPLDRPRIVTRTQTGAAGDKTDPPHSRCCDGTPRPRRHTLRSGAPTCPFLRPRTRWRTSSNRSRSTRARLSGRPEGRTSEPKSDFSESSEISDLDASTWGITEQEPRRRPTVLSYGRHDPTGKLQ
jgi:hypothetical protein